MYCKLQNKIISSSKLTAIHRGKLRPVLLIVLVIVTVAKRFRRDDKAYKCNRNIKTTLLIACVTSYHKCGLDISIPVNCSVVKTKFISKSDSYV